MSDTSDFGGSSLLDLFKLEAESHCAALSDGLLALERSPADTSVVEPLMRAAHSIKGAARIVGLDVVVPLAHAMEDCFLAAKSGKEPLTPARVDQLLRCVDVLGEVRGLSEAELPAWQSAKGEHIAALVAQLRSPAPADAPTPGPKGVAAAPGTGATPAVAAPPVPRAEPPAPATEPAPREGGAASTGTAAAHVRVAASAFNRMMFLAGESTVEASRLQALRRELEGLKRRQRTIERAQDALGGTLSGMGDQAGADVARAAFEALVRATGELDLARVERISRLDDAFRRVEELSGSLYAEVLRSRLRPFSEGIGGFPRMVRDLARELGKDVQFKVEGESVLVDRDVLQKLESPLTHMLRNSLDHGVETPAEREAAGKPRGATIGLLARHHSGMLEVEVRDDGRGIDPEDVRRKVVERRMVDEGTAARLTRDELMEMLFLPGFSTKQSVTEISGRGVGLNVVQSMAQQVGGTVTLDAEPGKGARFTLRMPVTRSVVRAAVVRIGGDRYAVPLVKLDRIVLLPDKETVTVQGRLQISVDDSSVGLVRAAELLGAGSPATGGGTPAAVIIGRGHDRCGLLVDDVDGEEDLVVRPLDPRLGQVPHISAAAVRGDGEPMLIIDVDDVWRSVKASLQGGQALGVGHETGAATQKARRRILVVDDSITVREVQRQLLSRHGYDVDVGVDGKDGLNKLRTGRYDLLITDVDMPRMTGIELTRAVRAERRLADLPVVIVSYKDREEDRMAGLDAGANGYLTKASFEDESLIRMIRGLIGEAT